MDTLYVTPASPSTLEIPNTLTKIYIEIRMLIKLLLKNSRKIIIFRIIHYKRVVIKR